MSSHYILYYFPGTAAMIIHWTLVVLRAHGVTFELRLVDFASNEQKSPEYLRLNPRGLVPVLIYDGDKALTESVAILMFLAERHPAANLGVPVDDPRRAEYLQTMIFFANSMMSALGNWSYGEHKATPEGGTVIKEMAETLMGRAWDMMDKQLEGKKYLFSDTPGVADFAVVCYARWSIKHARSSLEFPNVRRIVDDLIARKEYREVCEEEGIEHWPSMDD